jgi:Flp pilus assembly protein TadB
MLGVAFFLWFCTLPLLILLVRPWLGPGPTVTAALALLAVFIGMCLWLCRSGRSGGCDS